MQRLPLDAEAKGKILDLEAAAKKRREKITKRHDEISQILPDEWPLSGVIELPKEGSDTANITTSSDLQLDRS